MDKFAPLIGALNEAANNSKKETKETEKRPQNCGTGYCSCIECPYQTDEQGRPLTFWGGEVSNPAPPAIREQIIGALKLADDLDEEFCQGRISNHNGRKAAQMIRLLIDAAHRTKDLTDDEIAQAVGSPLDEVYLADFRAVIAADREKNNV